MAITLQDIASKLGVAKSTVSFTLRNHPNAQRFSPATRQRILRTAEELGYRPNFFAVQLTGQRPRLLMVCRNFLHDEWANRISEGLEAHAAKRGYRVLIATLHDGEDPLALHRDLLGHHGVPAVAILGSNRHKLTDEALTNLLDEGVGVVLVGREFDDPRAGQVLTDSYLGGQLAAKHIYEDLDLDDVWILGPSSGPFGQRLKGFRDTARALGRPAPREVPLPPRRLTLELARDAMAEALRESKPPRGLFAIGDVLAVGAAHAMFARGWVTGRDVAVVGFDGGSYSTCHYPPLTTVAQPMLAMGRAAADLLMDTLENRGGAGRRMVIPPALEVKGSTSAFLKTATAAPIAAPDGGTGFAKGGSA